MSLALEYIAKLVIILVVIAVVIMFIVSYFGDLSNRVFLPADKKEKPPEVETLDGNFNSADIARMVEGCWLSTGPDFRKDFPCHVLLGTFNANKADVIAGISQNIRNRVEVPADFGKDAVIIEYRTAGAKILVRN